VALVRCGNLRALQRGAFLPSARWLAGVSLLPHPQGVLLDWGPAIRGVLPRRPVATAVLERRAPSFGADMSRAQRRWLDLLEISSVGAFNEACIAGRLAELVRVSEGFHEKHIAAAADEVRARGDVRIIAVAGPSSSGKTTFIKRLKVQLQVEGIHPIELSLDDYYRDRDAIPRDADGRQDFETLDALDLPLLDEHLRRLVAGEPVTTARFDFVAGRSHPGGGPELTLGPRHVLLVEGIHALNPGVFALEGIGMYRVFVNVATSLPFDRLSSLEAADMRLLRRIVRDRHRRGTTTAESLDRWDSVRRAERLQILPFQANADRVFDSSLVYEPAVLKVFAERYLLEVPRRHPQRIAADRLRRLLDPVLPIYPDHVPPTSILREFIGASGFSY
jgi:uridine kinase